MKKKIFALCLVFVFVVISLIGCGASYDKSEMSEEGYAPEENFASDSAGFTEEDVEVNESSSALQQRKLIETVNISVQTKEYDKFISSITKSVEEFEGYVEYSHISNDVDSYSDRWASLTIRIPASNLDAFTALVSDLGAVTNKSTSVEDITLEYVDTQSRIKALRTEEEALLRLMDEAASLEDLMVLQSRLTEVRYQLESYESQLRTFDNKVNYATVNLDIREVEREVAVGEKETVWAQIGENLSNAFYNIGRFFRNFFIFFVSAIPYLAVVAVFLVPILWFAVIRPIKKRKNKDK